MQSKTVQSVLNKRVSRREFLSYAGATLLATTGVYGIIKNLSTVQHVTRGYGSGAYGGKSPLL